MDFSEINRRVRPIDMVIQDGYIWVTGAESNGIYELNMKDKSVRVLAEHVGDIHSYSYCALAKYNKRLFFMPKSADYIVMYDLDKNEFLNIELQEPKNNRKEVYRSTLKFHHSYVEGEKMFLLGFFYPAIICINMKTLKIDYISDWVETVELYIKSGDDKGYFGGGYFKENTNVYFPVACTSALIKLDLETMKTEFISLETSLDGIAYMVKDGEYLWLEGRGESYGRICRYNLQNKESLILDEIEDKSYICDHYQPFWKMVVYGEWLWLFSYIASFNYKISRKTLEVKKLKYIDEFRLWRDEYGEMIRNYMVKEEQGTVYVVTYEGVWLEIDLNDEECKTYEYQISYEDLKREIEGRLRKGVCGESRVGLQNFVDILCEK